MRILITTDWYAPVVNGVVTSVLNLQKELSEKGHDVRILTLSEDGKEKKIGNVYYIKSFNIGKIYPQARGTLHFYNGYVNEIIEWCPEVIHSQCEFMSFPFAKRISRKCKCPIVHTYHTVYEDYTHYFIPNEELGRKIVAVWTRYFLKKVDMVVVPTKKVRNLLDYYGVSNDIETIPSGIDLKKFSVKLSETKRNEMRASLGIQPEDRVLVSLGRLAKEKNIQELIHYMIKLNDEQSNIKFLIVGGGPYQIALEAMVKELNLDHCVRFAGMVDPQDVPSYYQLGDVFVCASQSETQGLTYVEALASGIPAVCKYDTSIQDVIVNGMNGFIYKDYEEFKEYVMAVLNNPELYQSLCYNARISAEKYSTWTFAERIERIYREEAEYVRPSVFRRIIHLRRKTVS